MLLHPCCVVIGRLLWPRGRLQRSVSGLLWRQSWQPQQQQLATRPHPDAAGLTSRAQASLRPQMLPVVQQLLPTEPPAGAGTVGTRRPLLLLLLPPLPQQRLLLPLVLMKTRVLMQQRRHLQRQRRVARRASGAGPGARAGAAAGVAAAADAGAGAETGVNDGTGTGTSPAGAYSVCVGIRNGGMQWPLPRASSKEATFFVPGLHPCQLPQCWTGHTLRIAHWQARVRPQLQDTSCHQAGGGGGGMFSQCTRCACCVLQRRA